MSDCPGSKEYDRENKIMTGEICLDGNFSKREYFLMRAFLLPAAF